MYRLVCSYRVDVSPVGVVSGFGFFLRIAI